MGRTQNNAGARARQTTELLRARAVAWRGNPSPLVRCMGGAKQKRARSLCVGRGKITKKKIEKKKKRSGLAELGGDLKIWIGGSASSSRASLVHLFFQVSGGREQKGGRRQKKGEAEARVLLRKGGGCGGALRSGCLFFRPTFCVWFGPRRDRAQKMGGLRCGQTMKTDNDFLCGGEGGSRRPMRGSRGARRARARGTTATGGGPVSVFPLSSPHARARTRMQ